MKVTFNSIIENVSKSMSDTFKVGNKNVWDYKEIGDKISLIVGDNVDKKDEVTLEEISNFISTLGTGASNFEFIFEDTRKAFSSVEKVGNELILR